jgi:hypothetical protein
MTFIRGRYHINPIMGEALEAAREAEAALLALEQEAQQSRQNGDYSSDDADDDFESDPSEGPLDRNGGKGPVHRVEIEAAEVVSAHSGRATRGYIARVHRGESATGRRLGKWAGDHSSEGIDTARGAGRAGGGPETHVFSNHRELTDYLHAELGKDCKK